MSDSVLAAAATRRELGTWDRGRAGPTLLVLAGMHGNEPAGVLAAQRVLGRLQESEIDIAGRVCALRGNLGALAEKKRYLQRDLNRGWAASAVATLFAHSAEERVAEDAEQFDLLRHFADLLATAEGPVVVVDLHTSSAGGAPFLCLADTLDNRRLGLATGVPIILGIEETIDGASLEWFADRGIVAIAVEGGQHDDLAAVANHEAVLWRVLDHLGMLPQQVDVSSYVARIEQSRRSVPPIVEIVHRHAIAAADDFRMVPGFRNFHAVEKGALLANDRRGEIRAPRACLVMLPLYQSQGDDGFFLARRVRPFWLHAATWLRTIGCASLVRLLPGVRRDPDDAQTILVDARVARWFVTEVFHLLGFRKRRPRGDRLAFTRRWSRPENARFGRRR